MELSLKNSKNSVGSAGSKPPALSGLILAGDYLLGGRTINNQLRTGTDKGNPTV